LWESGSARCRHGLCGSGPPVASVHLHRAIEVRAAQPWGGTESSPRALWTSRSRSRSPGWQSRPTETRVVPCSAHDPGDPLRFGDYDLIERLAYYILTAQPRIPWWGCCPRMSRGTAFARRSRVGARGRGV